MHADWTREIAIFKYPTLRKTTPRVGFVTGIPLLSVVLFISAMRQDVGGVVFSSVLLLGFVFLCWKGWQQYADVYCGDSGIGRIVGNNKLDEILWAEILSVDQKMDLDPYYGCKIRIYTIKARSLDSENGRYKYLRFDEKIMQFDKLRDSINARVRVDLRIE